jgi:phospholipid/cholesterol/gamma-HCH transport system substrate-binding protein
MTQETKLGLFVLVGLSSLVLTIFLLGNFQFQSTYSLNVLFKDIAGLPAKAKVKISGVDVGGVKNITLERDMARVQVWIRSDVRVHRGARASVVSTSIIGSKYLELTRGDTNAPELADGAVIRGADPISFEQIIQSVTEQLDNLSRAFKGPDGENVGTNLALTISNLRKVSDTLRVAIYDQEEKVTGIVDNVHSFTADLSQITAENREDLRATIREFRSFVEKADRILARVDKGEGTVGKLLTDQEMGEDLKATVSDLKETTREARRVMKRLNLIETQWDYTLRYDGEYALYRHDVGLRIQPTPDKFYYVGGSNVGETREGVVDPEEINTFNFLIGRQFTPAFQAYAGMIRTTGGLGVKVRPLWQWEPWRRLEMTAEAYSFYRTRPVAKPKVNLGARVKVTDWAYVGTQLEDTYYESNLNTYLNVVLRDDDIAYILGVIGLAKP